MEIADIRARFKAIVSKVNPGHIFLGLVILAGIIGIVELAIPKRKEKPKDDEKRKDADERPVNVHIHNHAGGRLHKVEKDEKPEKGEHDEEKDHDDTDKDKSANDVVPPKKAEGDAK